LQGLGKRDEMHHGQFHERARFKLLNQTSRLTNAPRNNGKLLDQNISPR